MPMLEFKANIYDSHDGHYKDHENAFSMVELIFIIVLMGILAKVASSYMPDNRLLNDTHYVSMKIKEAQKNAIGYDTFQFGQISYWKIPMVNSKDFNLTCIKCEKASFFESLDHNFSLSAKSVSCPNQFCFDSLGRPYHDVNTSGQLLLSPIDIIFTYNNDKNTTVSVLPMSGYVIIK